MMGRVEIHVQGGKKHPLERMAHVADKPVFIGFFVGVGLGVFAEGTGIISQKRETKPRNKPENQIAPPSDGPAQSSDKSHLPANKQGEITYRIRLARSFSSGGLCTTQKDIIDVDQETSPHEVSGEREETRLVMDATRWHA